MPERGPSDVLGTRALNRALLARQMLLARVKVPALAAVERLVGLQAQNTLPPYIALWTRLRGFRHAELSEAITGRQVVRLALHRSTIHLVTAADCLALRPVLAPALLRNFETGSPYGRRLRGVDREVLAGAGRALVEEEPRTIADVGKLLARRWPRRDPTALGYAIRALVPLVQIPPRGVWGEGGLPRCTSAEAWLGAPLAADDAPDATVLRYLAAFGPAGARDVQVWSGLGAPAVGAALERLRPKLRGFSDEQGRALFDLPEAPRPDPDAPAPPRFLPEYDNVLLSHFDRTRMVAEAHRRRFVAENGILCTLLVDGFVAGVWKITRKGARATLRIDPLVRFDKRTSDAVAEEGEKLLAFVEPDAGTRALAFGKPA